MTGLFIIILAGIGVGAITEIAKAVARRGASTSKLAELKDQLERHAAALQDAQSTLADQAAQLSELQERLDFAERLLARARENTALGPGQLGS